MIVLDATIVNVALPTTQSDLRFSQFGLRRPAASRGAARWRHHPVGSLPEPGRRFRDVRGHRDRADRAGLRRGELAAPELARTPLNEGF